MAQEDAQDQGQAQAPAGPESHAGQSHAPNLPAGKLNRPRRRRGGAAGAKRRRIVFAISALAPIINGPLLAEGTVTGTSIRWPPGIMPVSICAAAKPCAHRP